ncbi:hypothetical protein [uncultured Psychroserpens sp.]|uniref:hypothetical protein n=1 Tax=uncultured Psychroserpens sp. TaxID=255436 RepID=UPI002624249C|nr:hypothetical protein [uncultured Psychroserpens sp.]
MSEKKCLNNSSKRKEVFWVIGTIVLALIVNLIAFGTRGYKSDSVFDINVHDTYFVIPNINFILLLAVIVFFGVYLFRTLRWKFRNLTVNIILITVTIILILLVSKITSILDSEMHRVSGWTIYPPLSVEGVEPPTNNTSENDFGILSSVFLIAQIVLLIFLTYCGFKSGQNYKRTE